MMKKITSLLLLVSSWGISMAQEVAVDTIVQKERLIQVSFVYPLGTEGVESPDYKNNFSYNVIAGVNGGVDGVEYGGVVNINKGDVKGGQVAGVLNANTGSLLGTQLAGVCNSVSDSAKGIQVAGVVNYANKNVEGLQIAGVNNHTNGGLKGIQIAGVSNSVLDSCVGVQIAGVANVAKGKMVGTQIGVVNVALEGIDGTQIGVVNYSKKHTGLLIGVINITDSLKNSLPIGLLSIAKDGYISAEVSVSDFLLTSLSLRVGVRKLYNIFSVGVQFPGGDDFNIVYSYGLGSYFPINEKWSFNPEITGSYIHYNAGWTTKVNQLRQFQMNMTRKIGGGRMEFVGGPNINVYTTGFKRDGEAGTLGYPYSLIDFNRNSTAVNIWLGGKIGLRF